MKCKSCGFDPECDSLVAEGAPCGVDGCHMFTCCMKAWRNHIAKAHPTYDVDG